MDPDQGEGVCAPLPAFWLREGDATAVDGAVGVASSR